MQLGAFSVSLAVTNMTTSRQFYTKLGFEMIAGDGESWTIMANKSTVIGLFQGMFESNILTFNPGWTVLGEGADDFTDIRDVGATLKADGMELTNDTTGDSASGPASFSISDPDGNSILFDQHV